MTPKTRSLDGEGLSGRDKAEREMEKMLPTRIRAVSEKTEGSQL
jgi:hypothetical protein